MNTNLSSDQADIIRSNKIAIAQNNGFNPDGIDDDKPLDIEDYGSKSDNHNGFTYQEAVIISQTQESFDPNLLGAN